MTAALTGGGQSPSRAEQVRDLYASGMTQGQVALQLCISVDTVRKELRGLGAQPRLALVQPLAAPRQTTRSVDPIAPAVAYTSALGWHLVNVPPPWFLEMLEAD